MDYIVHGFFQKMALKSPRIFIDAQMWKVYYFYYFRFLGVAVRIEDDVLITSEGPQVLNKGTPQTVEEISAIINN